MSSEIERVVGRIEGYINGMKEDIERIEKQNGVILKAVNNQNVICAKTRQKFEDLAVTQIEKRDTMLGGLDERIEALEESGVPSKTKKQINVNSVVAAAHLLLTIVKGWMGLP